MNWKQEAKNDLYKLRKQQQALINIPEQIVALREDIKNTKDTGVSSASVQGGGSSNEDGLLYNKIVKMENLAANYHVVCRQVKSVEAALATLDYEQRRVLELFFIDRREWYIDKICEEFNVERSQVYRMKDNALHNFTVALYGMIKS